MKKAVTVSTLLLLMSAIFIASLQAEIETVDQLQTETEMISLPPEPVETLGRINGSGTYFEITQSQYLNVSLASSAEITLTIESGPHGIMLAIEPAAGDASTQITLEGLLPSTTYYKYEVDLDYMNAFTTDAGGKYVYIQDLTNSHIILIQDRPSYFITDDDSGGACSRQKIGVWDAESKTCTLIKDLDQTIEIDSDGITLDGAGFKITESQGSSGILLNKRNDVTVKNITIEGFSFGIYLVESKNNKLTGNTLSNNSQGIYLFDESDDNVVSENYSDDNDSGIFIEGSKNNKVTGNSMSGNYAGINLIGGADDNVLAENTATKNTIGISLSNSNNNVLMDNSLISNTSYGSYLTGSSGNTLSGNMADKNGDSGIYLVSDSNENTLTGNTISDNKYYGLILFFSNKNIIYNNNFISNKSHTGVLLSADNLFNMSAPKGGNYWDNYSDDKTGCADEDEDGFCDEPYDFDGILDELPWMVKNGWMDSDGDGIADDVDDCPDAAGPLEQNGCPYVDEAHVTMRIIDYQRSGVCGHNKWGWARRSCTVDLEAAGVKMFDREDENFSKEYGRWPSRRKLDDIYRENIGLTGMCTTDKQGKCKVVGQDNPGKYFVVAEYVDGDSHKTVYVGKFKDHWYHGFGCWWKWPEDDADTDVTSPTLVTKKLQITKLIQKNGYVSYIGKYMMVASDQ
jgi:parallel beta-helix repeat protein